MSQKAALDLNTHPLETIQKILPSSIRAKGKILFTWQFIRYLLIGGTLFFLDLTIFLFLVRLCELDIRLAQGISRTTGAIVGFFAHKYITFGATYEKSAISWKNQGLIYILTTLAINILVSPFAVWLIVQLLPGKLVLSKIIAEILLILLIYLILRAIFKTREHVNKKDESH